MYEITVDPDTLEYTIKKDGEVLPFTGFKNIEWAMQSMLAVINRTESEIRRRAKLELD
jgi:hypothetical protein